MVQWNDVHSGGQGILKRIGSNPGHGPRKDWSSTQGNGSQMGGLSDRRFLLGGLL